MEEVVQASETIQEAVDEEANIIFGTVIDPSLEDEIRVTVIATGFDQADMATPAEPATSTTPAQPAAPLKEAVAGAAAEPGNTDFISKDTPSNDAAGQTDQEPNPREIVQRPQPLGNTDGFKEEWDIPAYLRRRGRGGE